LVDAVVLGFLIDYTAIVSATSFSTIFFSSVALQILTRMAFMLKMYLVTPFKRKEGALEKIKMFI